MVDKEAIENSDTYFADKFNSFLCRELNDKLVDSSGNTLESSAISQLVNVPHCNFVSSITLTTNNRIASPEPIRNIPMNIIPKYKNKLVNLVSSMKRSRDFIFPKRYNAMMMRYTMIRMNIKANIMTKKYRLYLDIWRNDPLNVTCSRATRVPNRVIKKPKAHNVTKEWAANNPTGDNSVGIIMNTIIVIVCHDETRVCHGVRRKIFAKYTNEIFGSSIYWLRWRQPTAIPWARRRSSERNWRYIYIERVCILRNTTKFDDMLQNLNIFGISTLWLLTKKARFPLWRTFT